MNGLGRLLFFIWLILSMVGTIGSLGCIFSILVGANEWKRHEMQHAVCLFLFMLLAVPTITFIWNFTNFFYTQ